MPSKPRRDFPNRDQSLEHLFNHVPFHQTQVRLVLSHGSLHR